MKHFLFVLKLVFGAFFLWSGIMKLKDPITFADDVRNYEIVGDPFAAAVALFVPWLEVFSGLAVMWDRFTRASAAVITVSLIGFTLAILLAWVRGLDISCGCFGGTGEMNYPVKLLQNLGLIGVGFLFWLRKEKTATV